MERTHENYKQLIWRLAQTDFKLRYHGSVLGYVWAILRPLLMFIVLNFVFSSVFDFRSTGNPYYPLELLTALLLFQFFAEGTMAGMTSLISKAQLVTKIYVPRFAIVLGSTLNSLFVFLVNLLVLCIFFMWYGLLPSIAGVSIFLVYIALLYVLIVAFSFFTATLYVRFRDLAMIWEVLLSVLMYAAPIVYPLSRMPINVQHILLLNPLSFIIHYAKQAIVSGSFTSLAHFSMLCIGIVLMSVISYLLFKRYEQGVAELI